MLKAVAQTPTGPLLILGLTENNVEELKKGNPILVQGSQVGIHGINVSIMYGDTKAAIIDELDHAQLANPGMVAAMRYVDDGRGD